MDGIVDARQCGLIGDGTTDDYDSLNTCLIAASLISSPTAKIVSTGGGVILDNTDDIVIPDNVTLTCGGSNIVAVNGNDYRILDDDNHLQLSKAIVLDPTHSGTGYTVNLSGRNSAFVGCTEVAGAGPTGAENPYSPSVWFPNCDHNQTYKVPCTLTAEDTVDVRSALLEAAAFSNPPGVTPGAAAGSTGITITGQHATVRDVTVLGFGRCYSDASGGAIIEHLNGDCNTGVATSGGIENLRFSDFAIRGYLTGGANSVLGLRIDDTDDAIQHTMGGEYQVRVVDNGALAPLAGDTVWILPVSGTQSLAARWQVESASHASTCHLGGSCTKLVIQASHFDALPFTGNLSTAPNNGTPPTAITNVTNGGAADYFPLISVGQTVHGACIASGTAVTGVWPARSIVYISKPPACADLGESITVQDTAYAGGAPQNCPATGAPVATDPISGCVLFDAAFRFGDGLHMEDATGVDIVNCLAFDHEVAFHMYGKTKGHAVNCNTGNGITLPDRNLAGLRTATAAYQGNMVGLLIDGPHSADTDDACNISWTNALLGQHRPYGVVVQSNCKERDLLTNVSLGVDGNQGTGASLELDAGSVSLENADSSTGANVLKAEGTDYGHADLAMSNNSFSGETLYMENSDAAATTRGCGNVFKAPTLYLCAAPAANLLPGGRLALSDNASLGCAVATTAPVMKADVVGAACVFYVPYKGEQVPIYNSSAAAFGLVDIGRNGLKLPFDATSANKQAAGQLYDIFAETQNSGAAELCTGPAWSSNTSRSIAVQQIQGIWVNAAAIGQCQYGSNANRPCPAFECSYLGTVYMTADGQTTQQFGPDSHANGNSNCLCLYNAYNRVPVVSASLDSSGFYSYSSATWRAMNPDAGGASGNFIRYVDGLGESAIDARLDDLLKAGAGGTAIPRVGMSLGLPLSAPAFFASTGSVNSTSVSAPFRNPPQYGVWFVQAIESASGGTATFGGTGQQQVSLNIDD